MVVVVYKDFLKSGRGADRAIAAFANAMVSYGHQVHIVMHQAATDPLSVTFVPEVICHTVKGIRLTSFKGLVNKLLLRAAWGEVLLRKGLARFDLMRALSERVQACIATIRPDVIVSTGSNETVALMYVGKPTVPVVQMFHVYPREYFIKNKYQRVTRYRRALASVDVAQVLLPSHKRVLANYTSIPITVIGNAVQQPDDAPLPPFESRDKTLIYVAYFTKDKNHLMLLDAFAQLDATNGWELHLYGGGTPEWEQRIRARIETLGIGKRVRLFGVTQTPRTVLSHASICAYPSRTEGLSLALLEAMWCGLPCVGFADAQGVNETILDGVNGLLASPSTPEAFAAQLRRLIEDPGLRAQLGTTAARAVRADYTPRRIWSQWNDLLNDVVASRQRV